MLDHGLLHRIKLKVTYHYYGGDGWQIKQALGGSPFDLKMFTESLPGASSLKYFLNIKRRENMP